MPGTPSLSTTMASLPMLRRICAAGQRRSDGIAIRPRVRGEDELLPSSDLVQDFVQHPQDPSFEPNVCSSRCVQQLFDPAAVLSRVVEDEEKLRRLPQAQVGRVSSCRM